MEPQNYYISYASLISLNRDSSLGDMASLMRDISDMYWNNLDIMNQY